MRDAIRADEVVEIAPKVYPEDTRFFYPDGTEISYKSACQTCGYSLYWCKDNPPIVLGKEVTTSLT